MKWQNNALVISNHATLGAGDSWGIAGLNCSTTVDSEIFAWLLFRDFFIFELFASS